MSHEAMIVAPRVRDFATLAEELGVWMRARMPQARDLRVESLAYPKGAGRSHETIPFDAVWTEDGAPKSQGFVVRIKPSDHIYYPDDLFEEQIRLMQVLHGHGHVKVAKVFWHEPDPKVLGAPFFVMEKKHGRVAVSNPPYSMTGWVAEATPAQRRRMWENGVRQLALIPKTPLASIRFLAGPGGLTGLEQEFDKYARFVEWVRPDVVSDILDKAMADLRRRWPRNQPPGLVWGDARLGNMMFNDDFEVVAVMDWEQPSLGGALHDLAWWIYMAEMVHAIPGRPWLEGMGTREETLALWNQVGGVSIADFEWYEQFTGLKVAALSVRTAMFRGQPPPDEGSLIENLNRPGRWI
ncbi:MAG TPA: phosphotransferase family protein [Phenylobacterium sp.]|uniref:phosphotransferase family protein n=1 Tax=Phenylobacterium sp. TaxID=1871053 RepID=UPI002B4787C6|nr:phosphotransferase family protein [Phenylobacterium sp.]HKR88824.1 phosphotransferase family protein [Phenylobacterium sp.]